MRIIIEIDELAAGGGVRTLRSEAGADAPEASGPGEDAGAAPAFEELAPASAADLPVSLSVEPAAAVSAPEGGVSASDESGGAAPMNEGVDEGESGAEAYAPATHGHGETGDGETGGAENAGAPDLEAILGEAVGDDTEVTRELSGDEAYADVDEDAESAGAAPVEAD